MKSNLIKLICCTTALVTILAGCGKVATDSNNNTEHGTEVIGTEVIGTEVETEETKELIAFTDAVTPEPLTEYTGPYSIRINRKANIVEVFGKSAVDGTTELVKTMLCSVGRSDLDEDGDSNETPLGTFKIYAKYDWCSLFGNVEGQYAIRFNGHYLFHSVPYLSRDKGTLKTEEYNKLGAPASAGCIRMSIADVKWIYDNCPNGTVVEVFDGEETEQFKKPLGIKVAIDSEFAGWDPTDPDERNPWIGKLPVVENVQDITIVKGSDIEVLKTVLNEVYGTDYDGTKLEAFIENIDSINLNEYGIYEIIYRTTGKYGATVFDRALVNVVDEIRQ